MSYEIRIDGKKVKATEHFFDPNCPGILVVILENRDIRYVSLTRHEVEIDGASFRAVQEEAKRQPTSQA